MNATLMKKLVASIVLVGALAGCCGPYGAFRCGGWGWHHHDGGGYDHGPGGGYDHHGY